MHTRFAFFLLLLTATFLSGCAAVTRKLLYFPTHHTDHRGLEEWSAGGKFAGYCRPVRQPAAVWLFVHGNGGQAADRAYALHAFSPQDAVYILEYPGYGTRPGTPSKASFDAATRTAYHHLRATFPGRPVCIAAESIGSGPGALQAKEPVPPDKFVFVVPYDSLVCVAREFVSFPPPGFLLGRSWENTTALHGYRGPVDVFGARDDRQIPLPHAQALARSVPQARMIIIPGGHNDWADQREVKFRYP